MSWRQEHAHPGAQCTCSAPVWHMRTQAPEIASISCCTWAYASLSSAPAASFQQEVRIIHGLKLQASDIASFQAYLPQRCVLYEQQSVRCPAASANLVVDAKAYRLHFVMHTNTSCLLHACRITSRVFQRLGCIYGLCNCKLGSSDDNGCTLLVKVKISHQRTVDLVNQPQSCQPALKLSNSLTTLKDLCCNSPDP